MRWPSAGLAKRILPWFALRWPYEGNAMTSAERAKRGRPSSTVACDSIGRRHGSHFGPLLYETDVTSGAIYSRSVSGLCFYYREIANSCRSHFCKSNFWASRSRRNRVPCFRKAEKSANHLGAQETPPCMLRRRSRLSAETAVHFITILRCGASSSTCQRASRESPRCRLRAKSGPKWTDSQGIVSRL